MLADISHLIDAVAHLIGVCAWPAALFAIVWTLAPEIKAFIGRTGNSQIRVRAPGGFEGTLQLETAAAIGAAAGSTTSKDGAAEQDPEVSRAIAKTVESFVPLTAANVDRVALWVDDHPNNNRYERKSLSLNGVRFVLASTTEEALDLLKREKFDIIISDMQRPPDMMAGFTLLKRLPPDHAPYIIYRSSAIVSEEAEARRLGAVGVTNKAERLFELVFQSLASPI